MFDLLTLYSIAGGLELVIIPILIYYWLAVEPKNKVIFLFVLYKFCDALGLISLGLYRSSYHFLPFVVSFYLLYAGWACHAICVVSYKGKYLKRFSTYVISVILAFSILLLFVKNSTYGAIYISSILTILVFVPVAIHLLVYREKYKIPLFLGFFYLIWGALNIFRLFIVFEKHNYDAYKYLRIENIYFLATIALIVISTIGFFLLLSEVDKNIKFEQSRLNAVALEQSPLSIVITNLDKTIKYVNPAFCQITGYKPQEVLGKTPKVLQSGQTSFEVYQSLWKTISNGNIWFGEFINRKKNGELYYEEAAISPLKNEKGEIDCFFALKSDITYRKKSEELILKQNKELIELDSTKNKLFSIIAHDLRNPIGGMMSMLSFADDLKNMGETNRALEMVSIAKKASQKSFDLLENLLNWSRTQLNAVSINSIEFELDSVINEIIDLQVVNINQKQIKVQTELSIDSKVFADIEMIKTVIRNLVSNAIKFTPENGSITIKTESKTNEINISIQDTGVGIEKERLDKLFSFTENKSTYGTAGEKGTGLGLVLAHEFVLKNQGKMWVNSVVGEGTTFCFSVPKAC